MSRRFITFGLCLAVILAFSGYKARENDSARQRQAAWQARFKLLEVEAQNEYEKRIDWLRPMLTAPDARQQILAELQPAPTFVRTEAERDVAEWRHPDYGILLELDLFGDKLVRYGARSGTGNLLALHPQPPQSADSGKAEEIRRIVARWAWRCWIVALVIALLFRRQERVACLAMLILSLVAGAAWLVAPHYDLTVRGIFSNDNLFYAGVMYGISVIAFALRGNRRAASDESPPELRFRLRTLMVFMTAVAGLLAIGPFGYVVIAVFLAGLAIYSATLAVCASASQPSLPVQHASMAGAPHD